MEQKNPRSLANLRRGNTKHAGWIALRGQFPPGKEHVREYVANTEAELVAALGGPDAVGIKQKMLIECICRKAAYLSLVDEYLLEHGPIVVTGKKQRRVSVQPCLSGFYLAAMNSIRLDLQALGLGSRAEEDSDMVDRFIKREGRHEPSR